MIGGFLPTARPSTIMFDVVVLAMFAVLPILSWSIYLVRYRRSYELHKRVQVTLGLVLLVVVVLFEMDIRMDSGWWQRAQSSPYYAGGVLRPWLGIHLCFSISTTVLWAVTIVEALRKFSDPAAPGPYSRRHKLLARLAAIGMYCTALTGWAFYWMAFVAA